MAPTMEKWCCFSFLEKRKRKSSQKRNVGLIHAGRLLQYVCFLRPSERESLMEKALTSLPTELCGPVFFFVLFGLFLYLSSPRFSSILLLPLAIGTCCQFLFRKKRLPLSLSSFSLSFFYTLSTLVDSGIPASAGAGIPSCLT